MIGDFLEVRTPDGFTFWDFERKRPDSASAKGLYQNLGNRQDVIQV